MHHRARPDYNSFWTRVGLALLVLLFPLTHGLSVFTHSIWISDVNGAVLPLLLASALYLYAKDKARLTFCIAVVAALTTCYSTVVKDGVSIQMWGVVIGAGIIANIIATRQIALIAYVSATIGTWIGADLINLNAPGVMGGAGLEDGVFLSGPFAALFAEAISGWICRSVAARGRNVHS